MTKQSEMYVWDLSTPNAPVRIGDANLIDGSTEFTSNISPDFPLADSMAELWGQNVIRIIDRPKYISDFDLLYLTGDRRFGALGVSVHPDRYEPYPEPPLITADSLEPAFDAIKRACKRETLSDDEMKLISGGRSMGGAQPKTLVSHEGSEWLAKFSIYKYADYCLVEHATMQLAQRAGITTAESMAMPIGDRHVSLTKRFDRQPDRRLHAFTARSLMHIDEIHSYAVIADLIQEKGKPGRRGGECKELFRRMVFNILFDNTDDHARNHAFILGNDGYYSLSPTYDIPPQFGRRLFHAIPIFKGERNSDRATAIKHADKFGLSKADAADIWQEIADAIQDWKTVFDECGVIEQEIEFLAKFIDKTST